MNPLNDYPAVRKTLYLLQWLSGLVMGVLGIVFLNDAAKGVPSEYTITGLVLAFVWTYTGVTAQQNTPTE